jgi:hypothetical protein
MYIRLYFNYNLICPSLLMACSLEGLRVKLYSPHGCWLSSVLLFAPWCASCLLVSCSLVYSHSRYGAQSTSCEALRLLQPTSVITSWKGPNILRRCNRGGRSQWPRGLKRGSAAECFVGSWVRIPPGAWMFVSCECLCCQVEVSATGRSLV